MKLFCIYCFVLLAILPNLCSAQKHDTLSNIKVFAKKNSVSSTSPTPVQILNTVDPSKTNSISVADALKHFAGVFVKDFGGVGGLKTVSVRSLGANHTGLLYDGIALGNAQAGQIDLGKFSLDNISEIVLHNSGPSDLLSTAKAFSYASLLTLKTISGDNNIDTTNAINLKIQSGSFGYISPSLAIQKKINNRIIVSLSAQYQNAVSDYPFISYENNKSRLRRNNSGISSFRMETDIGFRVNEHNKINFKSYLYNSKRGLPGAIVFFNPISNQQLDEKEMFVQGSWQKSLSLKSEILFSGKYEQDLSYYLDPSYPNNYGRLENEFHQKEIYLSGVYSYKFSNNLKMSFAADAFNNKLTRTDIFAQNFATPTRNSFLNNIAIQFKKNRYEFTGNLLYTIIDEKVKTGETANSFNRFSNGLAFSIQPFKTVPFRTRIFYKNIFRAPTFNDLYYTNVGNTKLSPEFADQYNIGFTYEKNQLLIFKRCWITIDAYYNEVRDKILAAPRQNLFQWSVQNIGKVKIKGIDIAHHTVLKDWKNIQLNTDITYTFQQALDVTNAASPLYKTQLSYTPKHSGSASLSVQHKKIILNYNILFSSYRYKQGDQVYQNLLQPFTTNDFSVSYFTKKKYADFKFMFEANNIFNTQYEIIKYYPMPLSNYRLTLNISFKQKKTK